jgi:hypothetical protein
MPTVLNYYKLDLCVRYLKDIGTWKRRGQETQASHERTSPESRIHGGTFRISERAFLTLTRGTLMPTRVDEANEHLVKQQDTEIGLLTLEIVRCGKGNSLVQKMGQPDST